MNDTIRRASDKSVRPEKSLDHQAYQSLPRALTGMARNEGTGSYIPPHSHPRGQLLYATSGLMRAATENGIWMLPPNRGLWIPSGVVHDQRMLSPTTIRTIYVEPQLAVRIGGACKSIEISPLLRELILALLQEPVEYDLNQRNESIVNLILSELEASKSLALYVPWPSDRRLVGMCTELLRSPGENATIEYWAKKVGASERTLIRLFIKETGLNFRQWLQQVRLIEGLNRLEDGRTVSETADELGYSSPSAFSAMFRMVMGKSPSEYLATRS